jgi:hypothetical protein
MQYCPLLIRCLYAQCMVLSSRIRTLEYALRVEATNKQMTTSSAHRRKRAAKNENH